MSRPTTPEENARIVELFKAKKKNEMDALRERAFTARAAREAELAKMTPWQRRWLAAQEVGSGATFKRLLLDESDGNYRDEHGEIWLELP